MLKNYKIKILLFVLFSFFYILSLLFNNILPFSDSPNHIAEAFLFNELNKVNDSILKEYYELNIHYYTPNILHTLLTSFFINVETGNQFFYIFYLVMFFAFSYLIVKIIDGEIIYLFFVFLLAFNFNVFWGFSGFALGIGLILLFLLVLIKYLKTNNTILLILLSIISITSYYSNVQIFLFIIEIIFLTAAFTGESPLKIRAKLIFIILPALILLIIWIKNSHSFSSDESTLSFLLNYFRSEYLSSIPKRLYRLFWLENFRLFDYPFGRIAAMAFIAPIILLFIKFLFERLSSKNFNQLINKINFFIKPAELPQKVIMIFFIASAFNYLILPNRLPGQSFLFERFSVFFLLGIIFILSFNYKIKSVLMNLFIVALTFLHLVLWTNYLLEFKSDVQSFEKILKGKKELFQKKLGYIVDYNNFRGFGVYNNFLNYHIIWNYGITPTEITNYRFRIVELKKELPYKSVVTDSLEINTLRDWLSDNEKMDFILCFNKNISDRIQELNEWKVADVANNWYLLKKKQI